MGFIRLQNTNCEQAISRGAAYLVISERELFSIAYRGWFKQEASFQDIQQYFISYKSLGSVPYWVSHYLEQLEARIHITSPQEPHPIVRQLKFIITMLWRVIVKSSV